LKNAKELKRNLALLFLSLFICFIFFECFLRFYNPFESRVKGDNIILPENVKYVIENPKIDRLERKIIHTKNSLGFRGDDPPDNLDEFLSIITVGGSTTECFYLADNKTWPYLLEQRLKQSYNSIWLNNAGFDGHSSFGHLILLKKYLNKLRPKVIIFLLGINEFGRDDLVEYGQAQSSNLFLKFKNFLRKNSEVVSFMLNLSRLFMAQRLEIRHGNLDFKNLDTMEVSEEDRIEIIEKHEKQYLPTFKNRLREIIDVSGENNILPIFITQPTLLGGIDKSTGVDLTRVKFTHLNGKVFWEILELYNNTIRDIGDTNYTLVIDLADELPKDTLYFYDFFHFTEEGAEQASKIIYKDLKKYLDNKFVKFIRKIR